MGDHDKDQGQMGQNQSGGQNKGTTQVGTHGNQGTSQGTGQGQSQGTGQGQSQGTGYDDRSPDETYGEKGRQNQGQPNPQSQGNAGNSTKEPMRDPQTSSTTRPSNQQR
jgi:hypothetical protein